jgi:hypothetical protein
LPCPWEAREFFSDAFAYFPGWPKIQMTTFAHQVTTHIQKDLKYLKMILINVLGWSTCLACKKPPGFYPQHCKKKSMQERRIIGVSKNGG